MPSWTRRSASDWPSAWASVLATMNSTPSSAALIMLLTAFPPAPPTPMTVIRGLISDSFWGRLRLIVIRLLHANEGGYLLGATARAVSRETLRHHRLFLLLINSLWGLPIPIQHIA